MTLYILDTDHVTLHQNKHPKVMSRLRSCDPTDLAVTAITIDEQMRGRLAQLKRPGKNISVAYERLITTAQYFCDLTVLPFDDNAQERYQWLQSQKIRIGAMDKRIAAIVLEQNGVLVTRNRQDFERVPGLQFVDWSQ